MASHADASLVWTVDGDQTSWPEWANRMAQAPASELQERLASLLEPGAQRWALDVGCGTGRAFSPLARNGYRVIAVDPVVAAVRASGQRAKRELLPAWPILATAARLPVKSNSIGAVYAVGTLFHLSPVELEAALLETGRVLCPDGEALLHFLDIADWRRTIGIPVAYQDVPIPSFRAVATCFASEDAILRMIDTAGLVPTDHFAQVRNDDEGTRRDWFFHCVRS